MADYLGIEPSRPSAPKATEFALLLEHSMEILKAAVRTRHHDCQATTLERAGMCGDRSADSEASPKKEY
jgi:hypothetical protein